MSVTSGTAQETKTEKKIKIIVDDGTGTKVVIDTIITDASGQDPVIMKDGKVIIFSTPGEITHSRRGSGNQQVVVNVDAQGDKPGEITKTITVISSDSLQTRSDGKDKVFIIHGGDLEGKEKSDSHYVITRSGKSEKGGKGSAVFIYDNDDRKVQKGDNEKFDVFVDTSDRDEMPDTKVRYVVAKNGMVVTVEGNDEAKAKELFNEIEKKLDEGTGAKERNTQSTTTIKKVRK